MFKSLLYDGEVEHFIVDFFGGRVLKHVEEM